MSGEAHGVDAILKRTHILRSYGVSIAIEYVLFGFADVALALHNTGTTDGRILDEHLTSVLLLDGGKIQCVNTYISDVDMLNAFLSDQSSNFTTQESQLGAHMSPDLAATQSVLRRPKDGQPLATPKDSVSFSEVGFSGDHGK